MLHAHRHTHTQIYTVSKLSIRTYLQDINASICYSVLTKIFNFFVSTFILVVFAQTLASHGRKKNTFCHPTELVVILRKATHGANPVFIRSSVSSLLWFLAWCSSLEAEKKARRWLSLDDTMRALEEIVCERKCCECFSPVRQFSSVGGSVCFPFGVQLQPWWSYMFTVSFAAASATLAADSSSAFKIGIKESDGKQH